MIEEPKTAMQAAAAAMPIVLCPGHGGLHSVEVHRTTIVKLHPS